MAGARAGVCGETGPGAPMRYGTGVAKAFFALAFSTIACPALASEQQAGRDAARFLLFSGTDLWRQGGFAHGGVLWSPGGLDREGFVLKVTAGGGAYRYISGALGNAEVTGRQFSGSVLPGWRFTRDQLTVTAF